MSANEAPRGGLKPACVYFVWLIVAWTGAWLLLRFLEPNTPELRAPAGIAAYWLAMKLAIWALPALWLIGLSGRTFGEAMGFHRLGPMLFWGLGIGLALAALNLIVKGADAFVLPAASFALLNAAVTAPIVEEISFRGGVLGVLSERMRFIFANTIASALFVGAHCPGWYFQDRLTEMLTAPIGGALSIFIVGWIFGWVVHTSKTIGAGIIAHSLNNLTA